MFIKAIFLTLIILFSFTHYSFTQDELVDEMYLIVEEYPRFPGCEDLLGSNTEKEACATTKLLEYIYTNLKYPGEARRQDIEGTVIVQFVIRKDGKIEDITLVRDIDGGCGDAALTVVKKMNDLPLRWIPGKQGGRAVKVKYTLPVKFKLE